MASIIFETPRKKLLPFDDEFNVNGALGAGWQGATFSASGGVVSNSPSVGANLLTDQSLEANYTAGKCDTLTLNGSPTLAQSADAHAGSKAQEFTAAAFNNRLNFPAVAAIANAWYRFSGWVKRTAGTGTDTRIRADQAAMKPQTGGSAGAPFNTASYTKKQVSFVATSTANIFPFAIIEAGGSAFDTVIGDDYTLERLTFADLFALYRRTQPNVIAKVIPDTLVDHTLSALVIRADTQASPTSMVVATWHWREPEDFIVVSMMELSGGAWTMKITEQALTIVADAWLELRANDTNVSLWYNNSQVGSTQTVTPNGSYHGFGITGGNNVKRFFLSAN